MYQGSLLHGLHNRLFRGDRVSIRYSLPTTYQSEINRDKEGVRYILQCRHKLPTGDKTHSSYMPLRANARTWF